MKNTRSNGPGGIYSELALLAETRSSDNSSAMDRLRQNLRYARSRELTPRQAELLDLYFEEGKTMRQIAREQGVSISTVSRTIARAQTRLHRCLKYGL